MKPILSIIFLLTAFLLASQTKPSQYVGQYIRSGGELESYYLMTVKLDGDCLAYYEVKEYWESEYEEEEEYLEEETEEDVEDVKIQWISLKCHYLEMDGETRLFISESGEIGWDTPYIELDEDGMVTYMEVDFGTFTRKSGE